MRLATTFNDFLAQWIKSSLHGAGSGKKKTINSRCALSYRPISWQESGPTTRRRKVCSNRAISKRRWGPQALLAMIAFSAKRKGMLSPTRLRTALPSNESVGFAKDSRLETLGRAILSVREVYEQPLGRNDKKPLL